MLKRHTVRQPRGCRSVRYVQYPMAPVQVNVAGDFIGRPRRVKNSARNLL